MKPIVVTEAMLRAGAAAMAKAMFNQDVADEEPLLSRVYAAMEMARREELLENAGKLLLKA